MPLYNAVQPLDIAMLRGIGGTVEAVAPLGSMLGALLNANLVKTAIPLAVLWLLWLSPDGRLGRYLNTALSSLVGLVVAILLGRAAQVLLPFRLRPLHDPQVLAELPRPELAVQFDGWSAFPSDHGALAGALIAAAFAMSWRAGLAATAWMLLLVCLPRLYFGLHWPSDIVAGLALGAAVVAVAIRLGLPRALLGPLSALAAERQAAVMATMFLVSFEIASLFEGTRSLARSVGRAVASGY